MDWRHRAVCREEDPELFFPIGNTGPALLQIEEAKAVCRRCPVMDQCLQWALESGQDAGVWGGLSEDERRVHRQALAGMLWSKQYYYFDLERWLSEHKSHPLLQSGHTNVRNTEWFHMLNADVISMPDKWEYPWYAAWDLAFHTTALALVDFDFAKDQLLLMLRNLYFHPNGQIPAYEWNFSDVNPPVHAWATLFLYRAEQGLGREDRDFLARSFFGLAQNFNWWLNRKDPQGRNVFAGGFLGLELGVVGLDEGAQVVGHVQELGPLLLVEGDGETSESVDGQGALLADLQ